MPCQFLGSLSPIERRWHRFRCPECRAARGADAVLTRGIERLNAELTRALDTPEIRRRFTELGAEAATGTPGAFGDFIRAERKKWSALVRSAKISGE